MRTMAMLVIGSMVGAGVFALPQQFAASTGAAGAVLAWTIAGTGTLMLALVFQMLALRRPDLDAGVYTYAKAGFGEYLGFFSAFGYWASACVGNVTYWVLIASTLGGWIPALGAGDTPMTVLVASAGLWASFAVVRRGVQQAAAVNRVVTVAKLVPIVVFVLIAVFAFDPQVFADNWTGPAGAGSLLDQVRGTMLATVFVFLGVEGASTYSRHARRRKDVGRATMLGFASVFALFASVTMVSYGILPLKELAALREPSMGGVLEALVGSWGGTLVAVGLIISVLGAYLAWTLMAAEVLLVAARDGDMPAFLGRTDARDAPVPALLLTTVLAQAVLLLTLASQDAFTFAFGLTGSLVLVPYLLAAAYAVRLVVRRETFAPDERRTGPLLVSLLALVHTTWLLWAGGLTYLLVGFVVYAPATVLFVMARREQGRRWFSPRERVLLAASVTGAVVGVVALVAGWVTL
ncbi:basic amino acid/polyamine antiporter [Cellulomonas gilvus]|nr:basic amino acid/polyamine antiporter [Cellulomonas gilvus]